MACIRKLYDVAWKNSGNVSTYMAVSSTICFVVKLATQLCWNLFCKAGGVIFRDSVIFFFQMNGILARDCIGRIYITCASNKTDFHLKRSQFFFVISQLEMKIMSTFLQPFNFEEYNMCVCFDIEVKHSFFCPE